MRISICFLLVGLAWGQNTLSPVVRDAYSVVGRDAVRTARLRNNLKLVVCKAEYDAWAQRGQQDLFLFMDGLLMKGAVASKTVTEANDAPHDAVTSTVKAACAAANPPTAVEEGASKAESDFRQASDKVVNETERTKIDAEKEDAAKREGVAKAARENANAAEKAAGAIYAVTFDLRPELVANADQQKDDSWHQFLSRPWNSGPVAVSAGTASGPWPSQVSIPFERLPFSWLAGWAALFVAAIALFIKYARSSEIIRDAGTLQAGPNGATLRKAYSLARTQMALWTFLVAGALVFIFMVTWKENTITSGVLILLGISFGTTLLAAVADGTNPTPGPTQGFFRDLLNDGTGPSFHRYQMLLFTVILAVIFIVKVASNLGMPEFDATLLGLMGITNGTYLGFKLQDR